jgi:NTE family protein
MDIALALGGGGIKGGAHIGVIDRLENLGFKIRAIAGTSAGGLMGAAYAAGNSPLKILKTIHDIDSAEMYRRNPGDGPSIMGHAGLVNALVGLLEDKTFADLAIPFACTAVDLNSSREIYLREGKVLDAAIATMAVPGILPPVQRGGALLVDGGVLDPVPVCLARLLAPHLPIIAVVLSPDVEAWERSPKSEILENSALPIPGLTPILHSFSRLRFGQALKIFSQSLNINTMMMTELRLNIDRPDVILRPDVSGIGLFDRPDMIAMVESGRKAVDAQLSQLYREVSWRGKVDRIFRHYRPINVPMVLGAGKTNKSDAKKLGENDS